MANFQSNEKAYDPSVRSKLRTTLGKFGESWDHIAYFWFAGVGHNHFINTKFSKLSKDISDPSKKAIIICFMAEYLSCGN